MSHLFIGYAKLESFLREIHRRSPADASEGYSATLFVMLSERSTTQGTSYIQSKETVLEVVHIQTPYVHYWRWPVATTPYHPDGQPIANQEFRQEAARSAFKLVCELLKEDKFHLVEAAVSLPEKGRLLDGDSGGLLKYFPESKTFERVKDIE